jgi:hypothetical protein
MSKGSKLRGIENEILFAPRLYLEDNYRARRIKASLAAYYSEAIKICIETANENPDADLNKLEAYYLIIQLEHAWLKAKRPFYNIYPAVVECLKRTNINIPLVSVTKRFDPVTICFAEGKGPMSDKGEVESMLVCVSREVDFPKLRPGCDGLFISVCARQGSFCNCIAPDKETTLIGELLDEFTEGVTTPKNKNLFRLAIGVILLSRNQDFVEPILLQRDRHKKFDSQEAYDAAVQRAIRRGVNGHTIGKHLEVSPHIRAPHFGIRWTGKGHAIPKLVPIKGCVVKRSQLYPIPTGYLGDEETSHV